MRALRPRPLPPRMRPAAARLVRRPTGRSRGARAYRSRHVSRAVRCPSTCGRSLQSPGSLASTAVVAGIRRCSSGSTMRRSVLVYRFFARVACDEPAWLVARREPAQHALGTLYSLDKLSGKAYRARADRLGRDCALNTTTTTCSRTGPPTAGLCGAPLDGRLLLTLPTASAVSLLSLRPHPGACADLLDSPALPMTAARASARRPRRPRRARIARRSSGECQGG